MNKGSTKKSKRVALFLLFTTLLFAENGFGAAAANTNPFLGEFRGTFTTGVSAANTDSSPARLKVEEDANGQLRAELGHESGSRYVLNHDHMLDKRGGKGRATIVQKDGRDALKVERFFFYLDGDRLVAYRSLGGGGFIEWNLKRVLK